MLHDSFYSHTFKRNLFGAPFANYFLSLRILQREIWIFCVFFTLSTVKIKRVHFDFSALYITRKHLTTRIALVIGFRAILTAEELNL